MPASPLFMLNYYECCECAGFKFQRLVPLEISPVWPSGSLQTNDEFCVINSALLASGDHGAGVTLLRSLKTRGWAAIDVNEKCRKSMLAAFGSLRCVMDQLTLDEKRAWNLEFDGGRYVGFERDIGREFLQFRSGMEDVTHFAWPLKAEEHRGTFTDAFYEAYAVGSEILKAILKIIGHPHGEDVDTLLQTDKDTFGASVLRYLVYRDQPESDEGVLCDIVRGSASRPHADVGLITLAPRSSIPALELVNPYTGQYEYPETMLGESHWLVFAGETLSFLTGGAIQAPIHRVPWVQRDCELARVSAPLFIRASPDALLIPECNGEKMTGKDFLEQHAVGLRPWRLGVLEGNDF
eukprot:gnl/MRDRNA2_/MRDRNA2_217558_c0_seq1.p1 gnl/MRDRNA2_/MRDRNA2_217558_c0~~gnl/MRDRNA2_/MRDRNA2_217558_c0_seq1.p1  ORF type:complete len:378 (-),score=54.34 gnl/MRDRNA2_/MRDRNA2_217558_c0_seq1:72-1127(-)